MRRKYTNIFNKACKGAEDRLQLSAHKGLAQKFKAVKAEVFKQFPRQPRGEEGFYNRIFDEICKAHSRGTADIISMDPKNVVAKAVRMCREPERDTYEFKSRTFTEGDLRDPDFDVCAALNGVGMSPRVLSPCG